MSKHRTQHLFIVLGTLVVLLFLANLVWGSVSLSVRQVFDALTSLPGTDGVMDNATSAQARIVRHIVWESRIPSSITALTTGAALAICGLVLQSFFRNPLVGPSIVGISAGANLGVAIVILMGLQTQLSVSLAAIAGSLAVLALLLGIAQRLHNYLVFLIVGVLLSYFTSALITLLNYFATAQGVRSFLIWGMGNFSGIGLDQLPYYTVVLVLFIGLSLSIAKPLNAWILGQYYAMNLGIAIGRLRLITLLTTGIITAITTAYCGPIAFIGLCIPHIARLLYKTDRHQILMPASCLCGSCCALLCLLISNLPDEGTILPINAITPIMGVPVIIYIVVSQHKH